MDATSTNTPQQKIPVWNHCKIWYNPLALFHKGAWLVYHIPDPERQTVHEGQFGIVRYSGHNDRYPFHVRPYVEWYNCRDSFHYQYSKTLDRTFYYVCNPVCMKRFLRHVEDALNINRRTKFYKTNIPNVVSIFPAAFWEQQAMRLSLFSLILRAGLKFDGSQSWKHCLYDHPYIIYTKEAVERFFDGFTCYHGKIDSWWRQFDGEVLRSTGKFDLDHLLTIPNWPERTLRKFGNRWFKYFSWLYI